MEELKEHLKTKIDVVIGAINSRSNTEIDVRAAEAAEHLAAALNYLYQIKEKKK